MFKCKRGQCPIPQGGGGLLGEMTREYCDYIIAEAVFAGPKQYSLKLVDAGTGELKFVQKIRGITMNSDCCSQLNYEGFKERVLNDAEPPVTFHYTRIQPTREHRMQSRKMDKIWRPICYKGVQLADLRIVPFGYQ